MKLHSISNCFEKRGASPRRCWGRPWAPADRPSPSGSVPELEKLAAMSRLFGISLGWLLLWMRLDRAEARLTALESVRGDGSARDAAAQQVKVRTEGGENRRGRWPTVMARVDSVEDDGCNWEPLWEEP